MNKIDVADIADIAKGAAILGAGGGGDPYLGRLLAERAVERIGPVRVVPVSDLPDDALVLPVAMMGAPTVIVEKPPAGDELVRAVAAIEGALGRPVTHIACLEAGGLNSMTPIATAAATGLPLIDGDGMGRAFPELQMVLPTLDGIPCSPMVMVDEKGNTVVLDTVDNTWAERLARGATVEMGCSASIALYPMTGKAARAALVPGTLGLAARLGRLVTECRAEHRDAARAVAEEMGGVVLFTGKVVDVARKTTGGFARGEAVLAGTGADDGAALTLSFQNEHLVAARDGRVVASVPDLICVLDAETGEPVTTEAMGYGYRVTVVGLPCHSRWRTREGLALVGPAYFGYDHPYLPVEHLARQS
ncbi:DUF917 domain-containing protein [Actinokineospora fastidiosa]|uniref:DUF917 domain-containing protein n=1 Tax=Actinokineospora fastidiosa TaxID=1816 RepID=A0A918GDB1_9PSEU|nr:DUF917 domain-containing protein [Actinokineospora fastidiosa]GGS29584.1 hypothetical protein GCM10010171_23620 [Actinokineospora fastidiosa]